MTATTIDLDQITLESGEHKNRKEGVCLLEAVAWIAGEKHSDHPKCVCPAIAAFGRNWNDSLDGVTRQQLIPYIPRMIGTADGLSERRAWMCLDWLTRECTPAFLEMNGTLRESASALRSLSEISDHASLAVATPALKKAQQDAAAAWAAAWDAAGAAAGDAARDAAWDAARDAAWAAAWDAAWDAARADRILKPVVKRLQLSAFGLLDRMCALRNA